VWWDPYFWLSNPFVPWEKIWGAIILLIYLYQIYWVYRDANERFMSGAWFGLLAAIFPLGGWLFYLLYRSSSLAEFDLAEIKEKVFERRADPDYDIFLHRKKQEGIDGFLATLKSFLSPPTLSEEGVGKSAYSDEILRSRMREKMRTRKLSARESFQRGKEKVAGGLVVVREAVKSLLSPRAGFLRRRLSYFEKLTYATFTDEELERLIYDGKLRLAREDATEKLKIAREQADQKRIKAYQKYLERIEEIISREES